MSDSDKKVEIQIREAGEKLIDPPSSLDELLPLLDNLFLCLSEVEQSPPASMQDALSPLMKALITGKLFKHSDVDVKVAVAACISEITRITAPDAPYDDEQMKEVFKLIVSSFENLGDKSSRSYSKRTSIIETVAKVRSCVVMLDLECDALLIEMFQYFLKAISDDHPGTLFSSMENIMTLVLEESEDIPPEMLSPILHYVKKDDEVPQVSRRLAEQVLSNCASKLKTYLAEAVKSLGVSLDKYSNIVGSICDGKFSALQQDQHVTNEKEDSQGHLKKEAEVEDKHKAAEISTPELTDAPKNESGKSGVSNGVVQQNNSSVDTDSTEKQDDTNAKDEPQQLDNPTNTDLDNTSEEKPDAEHQIEEKGEQPSSVKQSDSSKTSDNKEETEPGAPLDSKDAISSPPDDSSVNAAISSENEKTTSVQALPSKTSADETAKVSSPSKTSADETAKVSSPSRAEDLPEESRPKKTANQKKKESSTKEAKPSAASANEEASEEPNTSEAKVTKKSGKKVASSSKTKPAVPPTKKSTSETKASKQSEKKAAASDNVQESSKPKEEKKKTGRGKAMEEESVHTSSGDNEKPAVSSGKSASKSKKEVKQPSEEIPNTNTKRKRSIDKGKASDLQDHDENLIGSKIKVWWPYDRAYYKGVVNSYDADKKKHLVCYDDGDQEILNLKKQKFYFVDESESEQGEEAADQAGGDEEASTAPQRKKAKTGKQSKVESSGKKGGSSKTKAAPASKSAKKSQDEKTESKQKDSKEANREEEEDSSKELSEEEDDLKTISKLAGAKSGNSKSKKDVSSMAKSGKSKDQGDSGTSKAAASSKKKEEPSKATTTSSKTKSAPAKSSTTKGKTGKGKAKPSTPSPKANESDAESESEETPKATETTTKGKTGGGSGKSQGSQAKSGKKRKR